MKKLLTSLCVLVLTLMCVFSLSTKAEAAKSGKFTYSVKNGEATITKCKESTTGKVTIPSKLGGYPVTAIGEYAFNWCTKITSVVIPEGVVLIDKYAFRECHAMTKVTIPESVTTIGERAFESCLTLKSVDISANATKVASDAFTNCDKLTGIWVNKKNPKYSSDSRGVLFNKKKTTLYRAPGGIQHGYSIPKTVKTIYAYAFAECEQLLSVNIPKGVTKIGNGAFLSCQNLMAVDIPSSVKEIGGSAFWCCYSLYSVSIPKGVTFIGGGTFYLCNISDVYYAGSRAQWNKITIYDNPRLKEATIHYNHTHDYSMVKPVAEKPDCVNSGYITRTCAYGEHYTEYLAPLGHNFTGAVKTVKATCTKDGKTGRSCTRCDEVQENKVTYAYGHKFKKIVAKKATCTKDGMSGGTQCTRCKQYGVTPVIIPALGHNYKKGVCTNCKDTIPVAKITSQPKNAVVKNGKTAKVTVKATGDGLKYQWYYANKGATKWTKATIKKATYSVTMKSSVNGRRVFCVITDKYGNTVKTETATLYMGSPAKITTQPKNVAVAKNKTAKVTVKATGDGLKYQWYFALKGATKWSVATSKTNVFALRMSAPWNGCRAFCIVTDKYGNSVRSNIVTFVMR